MRVRSRLLDHSARHGRARLLERRARRLEGGDEPGELEKTFRNCRPQVGAGRPEPELSTWPRFDLILLVPTLRVGMPSSTLRVSSVPRGAWERVVVET